MKRKYCSFLPRQSDEIESCCQKHDQAYGYAGPEKGRKQADFALLQCMLAQGSPAWKAWLVYAGVRTFGWLRWYWIRWKRASRR